MARALLPVSLEHRRRRADEGEPGRHARLGQLRVLGQEAVAGVHGVRPGLASHPDDLVDVEVGAYRVAGLADPVGLVGFRAVLAAAVLVGEDGHRLGSQLGGSAEGADGDLAAVGDQDWTMP